MAAIVTITIATKMLLWQIIYEWKKNTLVHLVTLVYPNSGVFYSIFMKLGPVQQFLTPIYLSLQVSIYLLEARVLLDRADLADLADRALASGDLAEDFGMGRHGVKVPPEPAWDKEVYNLFSCKFDYIISAHKFFIFVCLIVNTRQTNSFE